MMNRSLILLCSLLTLLTAPVLAQPTPQKPWMLGPFVKQNAINPILAANPNSTFFCPDQPYEIDGQVNQVVFLEGLVPFKKRWFLYYGTADSKIGVAVAKE